MSTQADYEARLKKIQAKMDEQDIDVLIATRLSTVGYVFGAFVPCGASLSLPARVSRSYTCWRWIANA